MPDYVVNSGTGKLRIRDTGTTVEFGILWSGAPIPQLAWTYFGKNGSGGWQSFNLLSSFGWQEVGIFNIPSSQLIGFSIGATGTGLGGPTEVTAQIYRNGDDATSPDEGGGGGEDPPAEPEAPSVHGSLITVGTEVKLAIPFVNVNGVWKQAESWGKAEGVWKMTE